MRSSRTGHPSLLNVSQIAELAGVGLTAVSNWRQRFDDFPKPVDPAPGRRDLFELPKVESWLGDHGRLDQVGQSKRLLFEAAGILRGDLTTAATIETLGAALALATIARRRAGHCGPRLDLAAADDLASDPAFEVLLQPLRAIDRRRAIEVFALLTDLDEPALRDCFEWLIARYTQQGGRAGGGGSSPVQEELLSALIGTGAKVALDPAAGFGGFLLTAWRSFESGPELFGQEINSVIARIARQRFLVHGAEAKIAVGDSLVEDAWPRLRADLIVSNPPFGLTDIAWIEHCVHRLAKDGRAFVFSAPGALFRGGPYGELRRELVVSGAVEAVIGLPRGSAPHTNVPAALWILRHPSARRERDSVLLINAAADPGSGDGAAVSAAIPRIAAVVDLWRRSGAIPEGDRDIGASVPGTDLKDGGTILVPDRWIWQEATHARRHEQRIGLEKGLRALQRTRRELASQSEVEAPDEPTSVSWVSVADLVEKGAADVVRGFQLKDVTYSGDGIPLLRTRDIARMPIERVEPVRLAPDAMPVSARLTRPGDVVLSPASGRLRALVDRQGGHLLVRPLQALRLTVEALSPELVAAFLESERNRRFVTGSTMARISIRDLEIPIFDLESSQGLGAAFEELGDQERLANELASSAEQLRMRLVSVASQAGESAETGRGVQWRRSS